MKNNFATYMLFSTVLLAAVTTACQQPANTNVNAGSTVSSTNATPVGGNDKATNAAPPIAAAPPAVASAPPVAATTATPAVDSATADADKTANRPAGTREPKMPQPQIGSGANDFYLYTQARAALNTDAELKQAALVIEVHESSVTLSGTVLNDGQKQRAARLAQSVQGVKAVDNKLRVTAAGGAK